LLIISPVFFLLPQLEIKIKAAKNEIKNFITVILVGDN
jgi:hypothetical protein